MMNTFAARVEKPILRILFARRKQPSEIKIRAIRVHRLALQPRAPTRLENASASTTRPLHTHEFTPAIHRTSEGTQPCAGPMSTCALQTKTMLQPASNSPLQLLGSAAKREEPKSLLPSKRKRDSICGLGAFNQPFTIKQYPESPYGSPATFKPVRIIGRSQLSLTFLDTSPDENFAANSLFSATINALENNEDTQGRPSANHKVLIARYENKRILYAIERVQPGVYSICRLANWLMEKEVADLWDPAVLSTWPAPHKSDVSKGMDSTGAWWQHAMVETQPSEPPVKRAKMTMMRPKIATKVTEAEPEGLAGVSHPVENEPASIGADNISQEPSIDMPSPQEQLALLLQQYLEAVYMSKTSLAYFAKGPVTRLRNAFMSPAEGAPSTHELVTFLRSMLLSPKASEKKYYDKLPALIKAIPPGFFSDEESKTGAGKVRKSKKKVKLSREGVYPHEEDIIRKWWVLELPNGESMGGETMDQRIKRRIGELRVRETLAQMILMLEIVALEALSTYNPPPEEGMDPAKTLAEEALQAKPPKRQKKLDDINLQLDLLLDRLCIWHATEEVGIIDFDIGPSKNTEGFGGSSKNRVNDRLHSFCVEVIIPFYVNRLPERALMVNKKLGGPAHTSPPKRKAMKPPVTSRKSGEPKEPESKKSRRSLGRVATDTSVRPVSRATPSLTRSVTDSMLLNGIKREGSEVPLSAIPFQRSPSKSARSSMSQMKHLQGRQIDLTQTSAAAAAKLKQKQRVEEDLQDAISALKKPNRGLAAGGYVADIERRGLGLNNKSRKPAHPTRKVAQDVQVSATPRVGRRTKNMIEQTPSRHHHNPLQSLVADAPPSGETHIPSSAVPATVQRSATGRSLAHSSITETPSKAPNIKSFSSGAARRTIFATPLKSGASSANRDVPVSAHVFETPTTTRVHSPPMDGNFTLPAINATPTKTIPISASWSQPTAISEPAKGNTEASIYDALGWNDDDDGL
ncbi:hypothetical protein IQ07DRAFT_621294 [Pyrenochaeta sp. DS3sAY3a]|nr:hypothetical protein IQ07DRAFT_621294 [Pyrenochaeta sp. DS3sAY3a]